MYVGFSCLASTIMLILPYVLTLVDKMESFYIPDTRVYLKLARFVAVIMTIANSPITERSMQTSHDSETCEENGIGQEYYRLMLMFVLMVLPGSILIETLWNQLHWCFKHKFFEKQPFDVEVNIMYLTYVQTMALVGMYFVPLMPCALGLILYLTYYCKRVCL